MQEKGKIAGVNGPVITVRGSKDFQMLEMVFVGHLKLIGEVIHIEGADITVQVYETTTGLAVDEPVFATGKPMALELGPGIIGGVFDGIQRPLKEIEALSGAFIGRGLDTKALEREKTWPVTFDVAPGDVVEGGQIYARIQETDLVEHRVMVAPDTHGTVTWVAEAGNYHVNDVVVILKDAYDEEIKLKLYQRWPVRKARPFAKRRPLEKPLITGQRVIDSLYPIAKGGAAAIPGGFGTGKTMTQHQLAKWSDADIIVYIGCGERGNEITEVLEDFPELVDPKSGKPLMDRTVLIANTSNMPVAAREASIYTGITIAEYYRDMGYHVAIMADSTSRWAEALREISGRLEEMPAEEGFPAYLPSRLSQFYERAGYVDALSGKEGSVSIIGAVSPQGGDFSEPVTQNTKRFIRCFWALDRGLAYSRHYPAIHWLNSYSEYFDGLEDWYRKNCSDDFITLRREMMALLQEESRLMEIVKLIGADILPDSQKLILEITKLLRLGFLQQNAFHEVDTYVPLEKQQEMMKVILYLYHESSKVLEKNIPISQIRNSGIFDELVKMKYNIGNDSLEPFKALYDQVDEVIERICNTYKEFDGGRIR